jgi:hypothetical protein
LSIKRLNAEERVAYNIGKAIIGAILDPTSDSERRQVISIVLRLIDGILSPDELSDFMAETGIVSEEVYEELMGRAHEDPRLPSPDDGPDDEIPF